MSPFSNALRCIHHKLKVKASLSQLLLEERCGNLHYFVVIPKKQALATTMNSRKNGGGLSTSEVANGRAPAEGLPTPANSDVAAMLDKATEIQGIAEEELAEMEDAFRLCDVNGDGKIDSRDLIHAMCSLGVSLSNEEVQEMVDEVNVESKGEISFKEFVGFMARKMRESDSEDDMREVFNSFDTEQSGYLGPSQLEKFLARMGKDSGHEAVQQMLCEADADGDGRVSFDDFMSLIKASQIMCRGHANSRHVHEPMPIAEEASIGAATVAPPAQVCMSCMSQGMSYSSPHSAGAPSNLTSPSAVGSGPLNTMGAWFGPQWAATARDMGKEQEVAIPSFIGGGKKGRGTREMSTSSPGPTSGKPFRSLRVAVPPSTSYDMERIKGGGLGANNGEARAGIRVGAVRLHGDGRGSGSGGVDGKGRMGSEDLSPETGASEIHVNPPPPAKPLLEDRLKAFLLKVSGEEEQGGGGAGAAEGEAANAGGEGNREKRDEPQNAGDTQSLEATGGEGSRLDQISSPVHNGQRPVDELPSPRGLTVDAMASNEWWHDLWPQDSPQHGDAPKLGDNEPQSVAEAPSFAAKDLEKSGAAGPEIETGAEGTEIDTGGGDGGGQGAEGGGSEGDRSRPPLLVSPSLRKRLPTHSSDQKLGQADTSSAIRDKSKRQKSM